MLSNVYREFSYKDFLKSQPVQKFLKKTPWCLKGFPQQLPMLEKALLGEHERFAGEFEKPVFSILLKPSPSQKYQTSKFWHDCILSCQIQSWPYWELYIPYTHSDKKHVEGYEKFSKDPRIKFSQSDADISSYDGDYFCIFNPANLVHPQALGIYARYLIRNPKTDLIYSNDVEISDSKEQVLNYLYKPAYDLSSLKRGFSLSLFTVFRNGIFHGEKLDLTQRFESQESQLNVRHIPLFTCLSRDQNPTFSIETGKTMPLNLDKQIVSVIVLYRDLAEKTLACLQSLKQQSLAKNIQLILVDNRSQDEKTHEKISTFVTQSNTFFYDIQLHRYSGPFNFGKINNWAISNHASGDFLLFLNNDVELTNPQTLDLMMRELLQNEKIAFVGIRLRFPEVNKTQHGGIKLMPDILYTHASPAEHILDNPNEHPYEDHSVPAVTFAAAMTRHSIYDSLGGLDDLYYPNGQGDIDICVRALKKGFTNFYLGTIEGIHHESLTRQSADESFEQTMFLEQHGGTLGKFRHHRLGTNLHIRERGCLAESSLNLPLRYRIADRVNDFLKTFLNPLHKKMRRLAG